MMWLKNSLIAVVVVLSCKVTFTQNFQSTLYNRFGAVDSYVPDTTDVGVRSRLDCGNVCATSTTCNGFYYQAASKLCKLVTYNYIDFVQLGTLLHDFYFADGGTVSSSLPWLFCPSTTDGEVLAISNEALKLTFRIVIASVSHTQAIEACENNGEKLMRIETAEKQALVSHIVSTCTDYASYGYWLDGYKDEINGWLFADGSSVPMNNTHLWYDTAPNNALNGKGCCVRMRAEVGHRWDDFICTSERFSYICEPV